MSTSISAQPQNPNQQNPAESVSQSQSNKQQTERSNHTQIKRKNSKQLKLNERWLKIPVDYNSQSLTDFKGLISKQRSLLSESPNVTLNDNTFFSKFKSLMGSNKQQYKNTHKLSALYEDEQKQLNNNNNSNNNNNIATLTKEIILEHNIDEIDERFETESVISSKMENNKPSQDYIRRFWMSDKNSGQCSECGLTFHTFRRKHHCRLCGRVFCQTCCSERININKFKKLKTQYIITKKQDDEKKSQEISGMMRVCVFCNEKFKHKNSNDRLLGIAITYPHIKKNKNKMKHNINIENSNPTINNIYDIHFKYVIKQLCSLEKLNPEWERVIYLFSKRANECVFPDVTLNDFNDIRHYVKVKKIEGGNISDCKFIDGVIFRKNISHNKMRCDILNPKILLLDEAIEYHRMNSKFHSFDILLKQNEEYMRMIVNKIQSLGPDIVIVSNTVSRLALQEMMLENITLICNIKQSTMKRIAHAIHAPIITSIDHINQLESKYALGHCGRFYIKYYNCDSNGNKGRRTPLMFFIKCLSNKLKHCTILLRGEHKRILNKVKNVIRLSMHCLYHINLEKSFLKNLYLTIPISENTNYKQIQIENEKHLFLSTSPFISHLGWRRENILSRIRKFQIEISSDRYPHLTLLPYSHHSIEGQIDINGTGLNKWDPFLPNTDNSYICQTLIINHCRVCNQQQCFPPKLKLIDFYTELDISLGYYLHRLFRCESCPNTRCKESLISHYLTYSHYNKIITIRLKPSQLINNMKSMNNVRDDEWGGLNEILMWTKCKKCKMNKSRKKIMNKYSFSISFGKFLEMEFYSLPNVKLLNSSCKHSIFSENIVKCFGLNDMEIQISSKISEPYTIFTSYFNGIITNWLLQFKYYISELNILELVSKYVFAAFLVKIDELIGLIGNYDIITKDLNKLRHEVNDECEKIATQFIVHRNYLYECRNFKPQPKNPKTISFLNKKRYNLYRISCEWNEVLDGLRTLFAPTNEINVDNTNRWMKKFKHHLNQLQSKKKTLSPKDNDEGLLSPKEIINDCENDELLDAALQEIDNQIATISRRNSINRTPNTDSSNNTTPNNKFINSSSLTLNFHNLKQQTNERDFEQIVNAISPRVQNVSFTVDFKELFEEHLSTPDKNKNNKNVLTSLKIPGINSDDEIKEDNTPIYNNNNNNNNAPDMKLDEVSPAIKVYTPAIVSPDPYKSFTFGNNFSPHNNKHKNKHILNNMSNISTSIQPTFNKMGSHNSYLSLSPRTPGIATTLFPDIKKQEEEEEELLQPTLNDVDIERLKQESLFLVATCTENSTDIGSNPNYAHLNLPKCFQNEIIPIYIDEPSAIISYTLSSLEYHCFINNIPTEKIRSCRLIADPTIIQLEQMIKQKIYKKREKIKIELEIRQNINSKSKNKNKQLFTDIDIDIDNELDLNNLLKHIPKLKHISKMEYLNGKKEYESKLKKNGIKITKNSYSNGNNISNKNHKLNHSNDNNIAIEIKDDIDLIKFQFIDPGHIQSNDGTGVHIQSNDSKQYVKTIFSCHVYYPHQFKALRHRLYNNNNNNKFKEFDFIESLSRCQSWKALGGKSGSTFKKTLDDRFVLKFVKNNEFKMFLDNAQSYFEHMACVLFKNFPSILCYILGVYEISFTKSNNNKSNKLYIIVMPNLWYSKNITKQFDLKGSLRNRKIVTNNDNQNGDNNSYNVMLDQNFIEFMKGFPMTLKDESKQHLHKAIHNDTLFLCRSNVIDYSLLVGINESANDDDGNKKNELVVGIIDYLRIYDVYKAVEEHTKRFIGNQPPTIQKPKVYKQRFREAMERYFMVAPDRKTKRIQKPNDVSINEAFEDILI